MSGEWRFGRRDGEGVILYANDNIYEGEWSDDRRHGRGRYTHKSSGLVQIGLWHQDMLKCSICQKLEKPGKLFRIFSGKVARNADLVKC